MANKLFVFDLDNTLRYCARDYAGPILDGAKLIIEALGPCAPHALKVVETYHNIDKQRVDVINPDTGKPYQFTAARFPSSFVEAYRQLCAKLNLPADTGVEKELTKIGMGAFSEALYENDIVPSAKPVLASLRKAGDKILVCTKGEGWVQELKIEALLKLGVLTPEDKKVIVDDKSQETFAKILASNPYYDKYYAIGDSYASDIAPALAAGFDRGVFMPFENWDTLGKMDEILAKVDHTRCRVIHSLIEIQYNYAGL